LGHTDIEVLAPAFVKLVVLSCLARARFTKTGVYIGYITV